MVTIAGPSSSGKTTFSYRLSTQLRTLGLNPHPISLDNYFVNREHTPKGPDGKYNYECMEALDISLLNENLQDLLAGKEVMLPTYNFISGCREYNDPPMKIGEDDILVIEGIHGLNDKLTYSIPPLDKYKEEVRHRKPFQCGNQSAKAKMKIFFLIRKRQMLCLTPH